MTLRSDVNRPERPHEIVHLVLERGVFSPFIIRGSDIVVAAVSHDDIAIACILLAEVLDGGTNCAQEAHDALDLVRYGQDERIVSVELYLPHRSLQAAVFVLL